MKPGLIIILVVLLMGCYEPKEACLDFTAVNYDVTADDSCPDCCVYPKITSVFIHQYVAPKDSSAPPVYKYNTPYPSPLDTNHFFSVERSRFFISYMRLVRTDGSEVGVSDSIFLESPAGVQKRVPDNFIVVDRDIFQASASGAVITEGTFNKVRFRLGIEESLLKTVPSSTPEKHALSIRTDSTMYKAGTGYLSHVLIVNRDTLKTEPALDLSMTESSWIELPLSTPFTVIPGYDIKITLVINYRKWFEGINFKTDTKELIKSKVLANLPKAFTITSITIG